jgi:hypothetical protein
MSREVIVRMRHIRGAKMCSSGARGFFQRHGLDWSKFLEEGISSKDLEATGDALAFQVTEFARGEE